MRSSSLARMRAASCEVVDVVSASSDSDSEEVSMSETSSSKGDEGRDVEALISGRSGSWEVCAGGGLKWPARLKRRKRFSSAFCFFISRSRERLMAKREELEISKSSTLRSRRACAAKSGAGFSFVGLCGTSDPSKGEFGIDKGSAFERLGDKPGK